MGFSEWWDKVDLNPFDNDFRVDPAANVNRFQATQAPVDRTDFSAALRQAQEQAAAGYGQSQAVGGQQSALADMLRARAEGRGGPSLAEMQLQQATQSNAAQMAGAINSQRGLNPALAARQALNAGAGMNQAAAGQASMLRAQEQQQAQAALMQALAAQRTGDLNQQQASQGVYSTALGAQGQQNAQSIQNAGQTQELNQRTAAQNQQAATDAARINAGIEQANADNGIMKTVVGGLASGAGAAGMGMATGGASAAGSVSVPLTNGRDGVYAAHGGRIGGDAPVRGDSYANDTVPAMLSPNEIVLPRSVTMAPNAPELARAFVAEIGRRRAPPATPGGFGRVLEARRRAGMAQ